MSDDQISVDATQLASNADVLRRDAQAMEDYLHQVYDAMAPHDPSNGGGDDVGRAIGAQYFDNANQLLHYTQIAATLLRDIADLTASGAARAEEIELWLAKINHDLSLGDPKMWPTSGQGDPTGGFTGGGRH